jgi:hypothetical protein
MSGASASTGTSKTVIPGAASLAAQTSYHSLMAGLDPAIQV